MAGQGEACPCGRCGCGRGHGRVLFHGHAQPNGYDWRANVLTCLCAAQVDGRKLTETINATRENTRYLPGVPLPDSIVATPSAEDAVRGADVLVFVLPHQYVRGLCARIRAHVKPGARAISLIKGLDVWGNDMRVFPQVISAELPGAGACLSLSGANIASEIALGKYAETTIGYPPAERGVADTFAALFATAELSVHLVPDVDGVALCGALKNIVALAAGFSDGMRAGDNTKAALLRRGLAEMQAFGREFLPAWRDETILTSAGVGDLITSCYGGRNRRVAEAFVSSRHGFDVLEQDLLGGQKLQGVQTATEVHQFLLARARTHAYPLFTAVYQIAMECRPVATLLTDFCDL